MEKMIMAAIEHKGFSMVEVISNCHTYFGRLNKQGDAVAMVNSFKENAVMLGKAQTMTPEELKGKHVIGTLYEDKERTEFCDEYQKLLDTRKGGR
jgi:2-oxoglutarate ferredoxin oxidoreductase subunit beta